MAEKQVVFELESFRDYLRSASNENAKKALLQSFTDRIVEAEGGRRERGSSVSPWNDTPMEVEQGGSSASPRNDNWVGGPNRGFLRFASE